MAKSKEVAKKPGKKPAPKKVTAVKAAKKAVSEAKPAQKPPDRMIIFAREYIVDFNATQAALRAGYSGDDNSRAAMGSKLLRNNKVAEEIERILATKNRGRELRRARVIRNLEEIANDPDAIDVKTDKDGHVLSVSRGDKIRANELLGRMEGLFTGKGDEEDPDKEDAGVILLPVKMLGDAWAAQYSGKPVKK